MIRELLLLPNALHALAHSSDFLVPVLADVVPQIQGLIAESEKGARLFLKRFSFKSPKTFRSVPTYLLNEHSSLEEVKELLLLLKRGGRFGLISDCGLPVLADPGARLVKLAQREGILVQAYPGPSSMMMALMLSGFSGQSFTFHGYLPRSERELRSKISSMQKSKGTQIFIETPYRTEKLLETLLKELKEQMALCVAWDLTLQSQQVIVQKVGEWKKKAPMNLKKKPAVFLISRL